MIYFVCLSKVRLDGFYFGPSEVRALPLGVAAEQSVQYFGIIFHFFLSSFSATYFLPEGVVLGLWNFAQSFKSQKKLLGITKNWDPPFPWGAFF